MGRNADQVVSVLAFQSDDPRSNPAEVLSFYSVNCLKRTKISKKRPRMAHFKREGNEQHIYKNPPYPIHGMSSRKEHP